MWIHETAAGTFWIRFVPRGRGVFILGIDEVELGTYFSPETAADDVYMRRTGFEPWDLSAKTDRPTDLEEWTCMDCAAWDG